MALPLRTTCTMAQDDSAVQSGLHTRRLALGIAAAGVVAGFSAPSLAQDEAPIEATGPVCPPQPLLLLTLFLCGKPVLKSGNGKRSPPLVTE
jgi:hypothetical protein